MEREKDGHSIRKSIGTKIKRAFSKNTFLIIWSLLCNLYFLGIGVKIYKDDLDGDNLYIRIQNADDRDNPSTNQLDTDKKEDLRIRIENIDKNRWINKQSIGK